MGAWFNSRRKTIVASLAPIITAPYVSWQVTVTLIGTAVFVYIIPNKDPLTA